MKVHVFEKVPNQVEKWRKFQGMEGGVWQAPPGICMTSTPWDGNSRGLGGLKQKCLKKPGGGGGGMDIFLNYTF